MEVREFEMTAGRDQVDQMCADAVREIDDHIRRHQGHQPADLSIPMLEKIRKEVLAMRKALDPAVFSPEYPRPMLDSWEDRYGLVSKLSRLAYEYSRLPRRNTDDKRT
jgi:hypothetical protein